nr:MAG TPA: hypothetical protein [Caudoviricetes sp.]
MKSGLLLFDFPVQFYWLRPLLQVPSWQQPVHRSVL